MSAIVSQSLEDLAAEINAEHAACEGAARSALAHAVRAGELLLEVKGQLSHGGWLPWLESNFKSSERTAQVYMRVASHRDELEANTQGSALLSLDEASRLLAAPHVEGDTKYRAATPVDLKARAATVGETNEMMGRRLRLMWMLGDLLNLAERRGIPDPGKSLWWLEPETWVKISLEQVKQYCRTCTDQDEWPSSEGLVQWLGIAKAGYLTSIDLAHWLLSSDDWKELPLPDGWQTMPFDELDAAIEQAIEERRPSGFEILAATMRHHVGAEDDPDWQFNVYDLAETLVNGEW